MATTTRKMLSTAELERLRRLDGPSIANAIESFQVRLRNAGFADRSVHCIFPDFPAVAGYAATARVRTSEPPMEGVSYYDRTDWWNHILSIPSPRIVVVEDVDHHPGLGSVVGEVHANILQALGCVALVTNGGVRDLPMVRGIRFQMFAGNSTVSHAYAHVFEFGGAVHVGGMKVSPGDLLHGDVNGVQTVPLEIAEKVADAAQQIRNDEQRILSVCRAKNFTIEKLREVVRDVQRQDGFSEKAIRRQD